MKRRQAQQGRQRQQRRPGRQRLQRLQGQQGLQGQQRLERLEPPRRSLRCGPAGARAATRVTGRVATRPPGRRAHPSLLSLQSLLSLLSFALVLLAAPSQTAASTATVIACDDRRPCTLDDRCTEEGECVGTSRECPDDGDACTVEVCVSGSGRCSAVPRDCRGPCLTGTCDPQGGCEPGPDGTTCSDENPCTADDICLAGACVGEVKEDGTPCNDVFGACTLADRCQAGFCQGDSASCPDNDGDRCTIEFCNFLTSRCTTLPRLPCDAPCLIEVCDGETGRCVPAEDGSSCDDENPCTVEDRCERGSCRGRPVRPEDLTATPSTTSTRTATATRRPTEPPTTTHSPPPTPPAEDDDGGAGGCALRSAGQSGQGSAPILAALLFAALGRRRRGAFRGSRTARWYRSRTRSVVRREGPVRRGASPARRRARASAAACASTRLP